MKDQVIALIPAFNEEDHIGVTVQSLSTIEEIDHLFVVDDGSTDSTSRQAKKAGAEVIRFEDNCGKGEALNKALASIKDYQVLLLVDADLGTSANEAQKLLIPVMQGEYDMVIADFPSANTKGGFGMVKSLAAWGIKKCSGLSVIEPLSGQRAIASPVMQAIKKLDSGFGVEVGLTIDAARAGFKIIEVSTTMSHAETGRDLAGFLHRGKQFYYVLKAILRRLR